MARTTKASGKKESAAGGSGTTATQLLRKDHKTVQQLFNRFEKAGDRAHETKQRLFSEIESELEAHATIEEEIFYPAVQAEVSDSKDIVAEAIEEHNVVKTLLREIGAMSAEDEQYDAKVKVLQENVEHHVEEEEGEMFPKVERELGAERLQELGAEMQARKEALAQPALRRIVNGVTGLIFGTGETKASGSDAEADEEQGSEAPRASGGRGREAQRRGAESARAGRSTQRKSAGTGRSQRGSQGNGRSKQQQSAGRSAANATTGRSRNAKKATGRSEARKRATATAKKRGSGRSAAAKATANRRSSKKRGGGTSSSVKRRTTARKSARKR